MYEKELDFLNRHLDLLDENKFEELFNLAKQQDISKLAILDIFFDPDVNINIFQGMTEIPKNYCADFFKYYSTKYESVANKFANLVIEDPITEIGEYAFRNCGLLKAVTISSPVTKIGWASFAECLNLEAVTIANSVIEIDEFAFSDCCSLPSIDLPDSITKIGDSAFIRCDQLKSITLSNSLTEIGGDAFYDCFNLSSITIPNSVNKIGYRSFYKCKNLSWIKMPLKFKDHLDDMCIDTTQTKVIFI